MFKKFSFYLLALVFHSALLSNSLPNREMIILLETRNLEYAEQSLTEEHNNAKPMGIGAISGIMLIALYQKAAPIIANKSLIKNIIDHQNIFNDFVNCDLNILHKKYGHYNKFKTRQLLKNFQANCQYISTSILEINKLLAQKITSNNHDNIYEILDQIVTDKRFNLNFAPHIIKECNKDNTAIQDLQLEMIIYTLCSWIDFYKDWDIKQVNDDIFLLIPKNYINNLNLDLSKIFKTKTEIKEFTNLELNLGLKIDHMKNVDRNFFEQSTQNRYTQIAFNKSLEQVFITLGDLKKHNLHQQIKHVWSVYMSGHGKPACLELEVLPQLNELKNLSKKKLSSSAFKSCLEYEKNKQKNLVKNGSHIHTCKNHKFFKKHINKIKKLDKEVITPPSTGGLDGY